MFLFKKKQPVEEKKSDFEIEEYDEEDDSYIQSLKVNLSRLIAYAESADSRLQREVAERLANEAVKPTRQVQIVEYGGLKLLVPLTKSDDIEVQRLAAHALANLSVNSDNQVLMAQEGAIEMLISLLDSAHDLTLRQSAKALANLGVNGDNKRSIAEAGGIPKLIKLCRSAPVSVKIEAIAALANLAVNDDNETEIVKSGGLEPIVRCLAQSTESMKSPQSKGTGKKTAEQLEELGAQCARAIRNLSVNPANKGEIIALGAAPHLTILSRIDNERISMQARRALHNLEVETSSKK